MRQVDRCVAHALCVGTQAASVEAGWVWCGLFVGVVASLLSVRAFRGVHCCSTTSSAQQQQSNRSDPPYTPSVSNIATSCCSPLPTESPSMLCSACS